MKKKIIGQKVILKKIIDEEGSHLKKYIGQEGTIVYIDIEGGYHVRFKDGHKDLVFKEELKFKNPLRYMAHWGPTIEKAIMMNPRKKTMKCPKCKKPIWDFARGSKLNKCWNCGLAFDNESAIMNPGKALTGTKMKGRVDYEAARELRLFIDNDGDLYRQQYLPIDANLKRKIKAGKFDKRLAVKLFMYLADNGARKYVKQFAHSGANVDSVFNKKTRFFVAAQLFRYWMDEARIEASNCTNCAGSGYIANRKGASVACPECRPINPQKKTYWNRLTLQMRKAILWEGGLKDTAAILIAAKLRGEAMGPKLREIAVKGAELLARRARQAHK